MGLSDDFSGIAVFDSFFGECGAAPHAEVAAEDSAAGFLSVFAGGLDLGEVDPGDGGLDVVVEVPVVVEPKAIDQAPGAEVPRAEFYVADGA